MSSPRTSQEISRESPSLNHFSLFRKEMEQERQEREAMLAKTLKMVTGGLILKLDGATDMSEIQALAKMLKENSESKQSDSDSDSDNDQDSEPGETKQHRLFTLVNQKIDKAMEPILDRYLKNEDNGVDETSMSFEDVMRQSKPKYLAVYLGEMIALILSTSEKQFEKDEVEQLKKFLLILTYTKLNADTGSQIIDYLFKIPYKNQETKKIVFEGLIDFYMPLYNALLNHCNNLDAKKETNTQNISLNPSM